jgi:hypothetical protein
MYFAIALFVTENISGLFYSILTKNGVFLQLERLAHATPAQTDACAKMEL